MYIDRKDASAIAGYTSVCDDNIEVFRVKAPDSDPYQRLFMMIAAYSLDSLPYETFEELATSIKNDGEIEVLKSMQKYVTHLKLAYLEHILTELAVNRLKDSIKGKDGYHDEEKPYNRAGRRAM